MTSPIQDVGNGAFNVKKWTAYVTLFITIVSLMAGIFMSIGRTQVNSLYKGSEIGKLTNRVDDADKWKERQSERMTIVESKMSNTEGNIIDMKKDISDIKNKIDILLIRSGGKK